MTSQQQQWQFLNAINTTNIGNQAGKLEIQEKSPKIISKISDI